MYENGTLESFPEAGNLTSFPESGILEAFPEVGVLEAFPEVGGQLGTDPGYFGFQFSANPELTAIDDPSYSDQGTPSQSSNSFSPYTGYTGADVAKIVDASGNVITSIIDAATGGDTNGGNGTTPTPPPPPPASPFASPWIWLGGAALLAVILLRKR